MMDFINFYLIPGLALGSVYALGAIGISMIFGILRFAHFAHGDVMTLGAYSTLTAVWVSGLHPLLVLPVGIVFAVLAALAVDKIFYKPLRELPTIYTVIAPSAWRSSSAPSSSSSGARRTRCSSAACRNRFYSLI